MVCPSRLARAVHGLVIMNLPRAPDWGSLEFPAGAGRRDHLDLLLSQ